jgi:hypothetical protein
MALRGNWQACAGPGPGGMPEQRPRPVPPVPAGWQCPRCLVVRGPRVLSCSCQDSLRARISRGMAGSGG